MLREDSERTLATILITNNFVNVTIIMLLNYVFAGIVEFGPEALLASVPYYHGNPYLLAFALWRDYA